jgi:hypothetical protein
MKAPAQFLRRSKHTPVDIDQLAVAIAHHRRYHADSFCMYDAATCTQIDETDIEFAQEMVDVLRFLPDYPG